jgi:uncharacterized membrane protein required for colicin V production
VLFAALASMQYYVGLAEALQGILDFDPFLLLMLGFVVIFVAVLVFIRILTWLAEKYLIAERLKLFNQSSGFIFGAFKAIVILIIVIWFVELIPVQKWSLTLYNQSSMARTLTGVRNTTVSLFGWDDPVRTGEEFIRGIIVPPQEE